MHPIPNMDVRRLLRLPKRLVALAAMVGLGSLSAAWAVSAGTELDSDHENLSQTEQDAVSSSINVAEELGDEELRSLIQNTQPGNADRKPAVLGAALEVVEDDLQVEN